jgi:hypothetical protein
MTSRKPTPILLQQLASRQQHMAQALEHLDTAIASIRRVRPRSDALTERLEALRAHLQRHAAEDEGP